MSSEAGDRTAEGGASASMQLNEAPDPSPPPVYGPFAPGQGPNSSVQVPYAPGYTPPFAPGAPSLATDPARKKAAAEAIRTRIKPQTKSAGEHADEETSAAVKGLGAKDGDGWVTSRALKDAHKTWGGQVRSMLGRLDADINSLSGARRNLFGADVQGGLGFRRVSPFDNF
ncbi:hypothetical protein [Streptomyces sp. ISL-111]|uniref:hypothetical protein n=1 Tax=unclassified Streptomyces TaxID=2593676 RepID=UPI0035AB9977